MPLGGKIFTTTLAQPDGTEELPVALGDQTGLVTGIEPVVFKPGIAFGEGIGPTITADAKDPNVLVVTWTGGACDNRAVISFVPAALRYRMTLRTDVAWGACMALGLFRAIRVTTSQPIPVGDIDVPGA